MKGGQNKYKTEEISSRTQQVVVNFWNFLCHRNFLLLDNIIRFRKGLHTLTNNRFLNRKAEICPQIPILQQLWMLRGRTRGRTAESGQVHVLYRSSVTYSKHQRQKVVVDGFFVWSRHGWAGHFFCFCVVSWSNFSHVMKIHANFKSHSVLRKSRKKKISHSHYGRDFFSFFFFLSV